MRNYEPVTPTGGSSQLPPHWAIVISNALWIGENPTSTHAQMMDGTVVDTQKLANAISNTISLADHHERMQLAIGRKQSGRS